MSDGHSSARAVHARRQAGGQAYIAHKPALAAGRLETGNLAVIEVTPVACDLRDLGDRQVSRLQSRVGICRHFLPAALLKLKT